MRLSHLRGIGLDVVEAATGPVGEDAGGDAGAPASEPGRAAPRPKISSASFGGWLEGLLAEGELGARYPAACRSVAGVACSWRDRFPGPLWARLARDGCSTLIKESREAVPVVAFVQKRVAELSPEDGPVTILDLCSGLGFLGMLLVELLPPERVHVCVLVDQAWPLKGAPPRDADGGEESRRKRTRLNWDHVYGLPWPAPLTTRRSDLKLPSTHKQMLEKILEPAPGPVFVLGIHLCGLLSIRAVETFNRGPKCAGLVLKPCCLPCQEYAKSRTNWRLGAHSFAATEVAMWGKYNKNQWHGPAKHTLASRFRCWADNLYRGIVADAKSYERVPLVEGHYQDAYLFAERDFSPDAPPPPPSLEEDGPALVRQILAASAPADVLGVSADASGRALHRRFAALSRSIGLLMPEMPEAEEAFIRLKVAYDGLRAEKRESVADHDT